MKYSIKVNEVKNPKKNLLGFATVVFDDSFKVTNIAILRNNNGGMFVSMPRYKSSERDENNGFVYKNICNPITKEFRNHLYDSILSAYKNLLNPNVKGDAGKGIFEYSDAEKWMPLQFTVSVVPYQREGSNVRGLARIYLEESFIINNISVIEGKEGVFVAMPSYKTGKVDEKNKPVYQDVCYPITKEFRERVKTEIKQAYEMAKEKRQEQTQDIFYADEDGRDGLGASEFQPIPDDLDELLFR